MSRPPLVLDLGNVLVTLDFERFVQGAAVRSPRPADVIRDRYILGEPKRRYERGGISCAEFFTEMATWLDWPSGGEASLREVWCDIFAAVPGAERAVSSLVGDWELWLLSDTNPSHLAWCLARWPWLGSFSRRFVSHEQGRLKAEPGGFAAIVASADAGERPPIFYDDLPHNVEAARRAGIDGRLFESWPEALTELGAVT
jgi:glucose-1-phosphatase